KPTTALASSGTLARSTRVATGPPGQRICTSPCTASASARTGYAGTCRTRTRAFAHRRPICSLRTTRSTCSRTAGCRTARRRATRAKHARAYRYAWATYPYIALYRFGIRAEWLRWHVQEPDAGICSQAADLLLADNTIHLFADGGMPYDVTPGDLATLA